MSLIKTFLLFFAVSLLGCDTALSPFSNASAPLVPLSVGTRWTHAGTGLLPHTQIILGDTVVAGDTYTRVLNVVDNSSRGIRNDTSISYLLWASRTELHETSGFFGSGTVVLDTAIGGTWRESYQIGTTSYSDHYTMMGTVPGRLVASAQHTKYYADVWRAHLVREIRTGNTRDTVEGDQYWAHGVGFVETVIDDSVVTKYLSHICVGCQP